MLKFTRAGRPVQTLFGVTMDRIHLKTLRIALCGNDKLPKNFSLAAEYVSVYNSRGNYLGDALTRVDVSTPPQAGKRSSSKHRIFVRVGGQWVPAGRLTQCKAFKAGARFYPFGDEKKS